MDYSTRRRRGGTVSTGFLVNILLVYPEFPDTFWSFRRALKFAHKRASLPPLGLLTVAALLPGDWNKRLVDMNVRRLRDRDLAWADLVFVGAMMVQRGSARAVIARARAAGRTVVAGGPLFQDEAERGVAADHFVLNEAELTLPPFLRDFAAGTARRVYTADGFADLRTTPAPMWELLDLSRYAGMSVQYSRGCPFNCDFCNVTALLGRRVRRKTSAQVLHEMDRLYARGWRGNVFVVDDNFIGNRRALKRDLLPALTAWRKGRTGFTFNTETSIDLADDPELMDAMAAAGFDTVFVGIETPDEECLAECSKTQNRNRDLVADVKRIQRAGLQVQGGFIVGFDHDPPGIFQRQIDFIQRSGIVTAMVGLLQAPPGTRLYARMAREGRLRQAASGDNADGTTNIEPAMGLATLKSGYRHILRSIYAPKPYYRRIRTFLREYRPPAVRLPFSGSRIVALGHSLYRLGLIGRERVHYWKLLLWTALRRPRLLPEAVTLAIYGHHFRKLCERTAGRCRAATGGGRAVRSDAPLASDTLTKTG